MLSARTRDILRSAGWEPERRCDITKYEAAYSSKGYPIIRLVLEFLREFGDLTLSYPHFRNPEAMDGCNFRAVEACAWDRPWLRGYEKHIGQLIVPIGHAFSDHMLLVMAEDGAVFACLEDMVCKVGENASAALNALCEGQELECAEIDEPDEPSNVSAEIDGSLRVNLERAGWQPGRSVAIDQELAALNQHGFSVPDCVPPFLREFGHLQIRTDGPGQVLFIPSDAIARLGGETVLHFRASLGIRDLVPIGTIDPAEIVSLMDEAGRVYGVMPGIPDWLVKYGETPVASLHAIVSCQGAVRVV